LTVIGYMSILSCMKNNQNYNFKLAGLKAEVIKAIGHPTRLSIVEILAAGEKCVGDLNKILNIEHSTLSKHLSVLRKTGVVADRKEGLNVFYSLEVPCIVNFINCITQVIEKRASKEISALRK